MNSKRNKDSKPQIKRTANAIDNGRKLQKFSFNSANFMFNIIKTNTKSTAIAPTQITMKAIGRNSKLKRNKIQETLVKEKIKNKIEKIGFLEETTKIDDNKQKVEKIKNKIDTAIKSLVQDVFLTPNTLRRVFLLVTPKRSNFPRIVE